MGEILSCFSNLHGTRISSRLFVTVSIGKALAYMILAYLRPPLSKMKLEKLFLRWVVLNP